MPRERTTLVHINPIDRTWPEGSVERFLVDAQIPTDGVCVNAVSTSATGIEERLARARVYFLGEWRLLADPLIHYPARSFGVHKMLILMRLGWCHHVEHVPPEQIIWAPGLGADPAMEGKAKSFWLRPVQSEELKTAPGAVSVVSKESYQSCKGSPTGLWCLDRAHVDEVKQRTAQLRYVTKLPYRFNDSFASEISLAYSEMARGCLDEVAV